jgi:alpha-tubulin suppressor-like RCC1 family protein
MGVTFSSIALGSTFACGLASTGVGYCWGNNAFGQLGDATTTNHPTPATVVMPAGVTFTTLAVGVNHACATTGSGDVYCWGNNANAQLGDGTTTNHSTAALVTMPSGVTFTSLTAGASHTCGMTSTNVAYCWGLNASGQLGDGTLVQRTTAVPALLP